MSEAPSPAMPRPPSLPAPLAYTAALLMTGAATLLAVVLDRLAPVPNLSLVFVLPVAVAAASLGWGPSFVAVGASVAAYNFFLIAPRYTFEVAEPASVLAILLLTVIAGLIGAIASRSRRRAMIAVTAADQAAAINALARRLVGAPELTDVAEACAEALARLFEAEAVVFLETADGLTPAALGGGARLATADQEAAAWCLAAGLPSRGGAYPVGEAAFDFWPVISQKRRRAVVGLRISDREAGRPGAPERLVEIVCGYLAVALDREAYAAEVLSARVERARERVKADLLAAVSHDLKTPLSTVLFSLQSLQRFESSHDPETRRELLSLAERETERLNGMVGALLDVSRLEAGAVAVRPEAIEPADLIATVLQQHEAALAGRPIRVEVGPDLAPLLVDPVLFGSALGNVLENAALYAGEGSPLFVRAGQADATGWIEVLDEGPGFTGPIEPLFDRFVRGAEGDGRPAGIGLGLAIARGFMEAQDGAVEAANRTDRTGARVRLVAPRADRL